MAGNGKKPIQISFGALCGVITPPPPGNVSPVINSGFAPVGIKEIADNAAGENIAYHTRYATLKFTDSNAADVHSASAAPLGGGYKGTFSLGAVDQAANCIKWTFKVRDDKLDYLQEGQTLTQKYKITINDGHGGTTSKVVTVILVGSNDAPEIQSFNDGEEQFPPFGSVTEDLNPDASGRLTDTGTFTFDDVDLKDTHTTSVTKNSSDLPGAGGTLIAVITDPATGAGNGTIKWTYKVDNSLVQYLDDGEHATETFTIKVDDGHGGFDTQIVTVVVNGVNDPPVADDETNSTPEDTTLTVSGLGGVLIGDTDADGDPLSVTDFTVDGVAGIFLAGQTASIPGIGDLTINPDGSYTFIPAPNYNGPVPVATYTVSDGTATDQGTLTLNVTPLDNPVTINGLGIEGGDQTVDEDNLMTGTSPNPGALAQTGSFTVSAPDGFGNLDIGGTLVITAGSVTNIGVPITTPLGTLVITGVNLTTGVVDYEYTLSANTFTHGPANDGENIVLDSIPVSLTDADGSAASSAIVIKIVDDVPTAGPNPVIHVCSLDDEDDDDTYLDLNPHTSVSPENQYEDNGDHEVADNSSGLALVTGTLAHNFGADQAGTIALTDVELPAVGGFTQSGTGTLITVQQNGVDVFLVELTDPVTGEYQITQLAPLCHDDDDDDDDGDDDGGAYLYSLTQVHSHDDDVETADEVIFNLHYAVTDGDGDVAFGTAAISVCCSHEDDEVETSDNSNGNDYGETYAANVSVLNPDQSGEELVPYSEEHQQSDISSLLADACLAAGPIPEQNVCIPAYGSLPSEPEFIA